MARELRPGSQASSDALYVEFPDENLEQPELQEACPWAVCPSRPVTPTGASGRTQECQGHVSTLRCSTGAAPCAAADTALRDLKAGRARGTTPPHDTRGASPKVRGLTVEGPALTKLTLPKGRLRPEGPEGRGPPCKTAWGPAGWRVERAGDVAGGDEGPPGPSQRCWHPVTLPAFQVVPPRDPEPGHGAAPRGGPPRVRGSQSHRRVNPGSEAGLDWMHSSKHPPDDGLRRQRDGGRRRPLRHR